MKILKKLDFVNIAASGEGGSSVDFDVPFPGDYNELLQQVSLL